MIAVLAVVMAGCSTSTAHNTSTNRNTSTHHNEAPVPNVTGVAPPSGTTEGGTTVTITGTGFTGATKVVFGSVAATSYTVVSDTKIIAVSPAQPASIQDIHVTTAGGTSEPVTAVDPFTYVPPVSAITAIAPPSGTTAGGTTVTITGTGFTGATGVLFGTVAAPAFTVVSDSEITAVSPAEPAGVEDIQVTTAGGTSTSVAAVAQFTFTVSAPAVTLIAPSTGTTAGGTTVAIFGTGFTGATKVVFGTVAAASYTVVSATEISAVSPAQGAGTRSILVTTAGGTSVPGSAVDQFTYRA